MRTWAFAGFCVIAAAWFGLAEPGQQAWLLLPFGALVLSLLWDRDHSYRWSFAWPIALIALTAVVLTSQYLLTIKTEDLGFGDAGALLGDLGRLPIARDRDAYLDKLGLLFLSAFAFLGGLALGGNYGRTLRFLRLFVMANAVLVAVTLLLYAINPNLLLWEPRTSYQGFFTISFVNRNTAATYLGMSAILAAALLARDLQDTRVRQIAFSFLVTRAEVRGISPLTVFIHAASLLIFLAGLFATGSRGGISASLLGLAVFTGAYVIKERRWALGALFTAAATLVVVVFALQNEALLSSRFDDLSALNTIDRYRIYTSSSALARENITHGVGLGGFATSLSEHRSDQMTPNTILDRAHSTPLEMLVEHGVWYTLAAALGWFVLAGGLLTGVIGRRRRHIIPAAGLAIWTLASVHMTFDFSLQIAGFAIGCFGVLGVCYAQALSRHRMTISQAEARATV